MKTLFNIFHTLVSLILGLIVAVAYLFIFTPTHMICMLCAGMTFEEWQEVWTESFKSTFLNMYE